MGLFSAHVAHDLDAEAIVQGRWRFIRVKQHFPSVLVATIAKKSVVNHAHLVQLGACRAGRLPGKKTSFAGLGTRNWGRVFAPG